MNAIAATWQRMVRRGRPVRLAAPETTHPVPVPADVVEVPAVDIAPNDPIIAYLESAVAAVEIDTLELDSPAVRALRAAGVKLVVPLVSQRELIGTLNLGPRLSEQDYSTDDRKLLENLAAQAAPAVRVAQLVREQEAAARGRERIEHELQVARLIQQHFLPKVIPALPGWTPAAYYRPAREVSGDFYDVFPVAEGQMGIVIGDVTDKGVPAALVMAATRSVLRAAAQQYVSPGELLERVNDLLCPDMPPNMFVTCLFAVLEPATGRLHYANAGHDLPYVYTEGGTVELRARGVPLGLMPGSTYEEKEAFVQPGQNILFYSDGVVEAHSPEHEMFGFGRVKHIVARHPGSQALIEALLAELARFTGADWEQEDDVTLLVLARDAEQVIAEFTIPSEPGNERLAIARVEDGLRDLPLSPRRMECMKTAVAEATMNAIEHGNKSLPELPVTIKVVVSNGDLHVRITDTGRGGPIPESTPQPDLEAKLRGLQSPRGWGEFLMKRMVDDMQVTWADGHNTIELIVHLDERAAAPAGGPD